MTGGPARPAGAAAAAFVGVTAAIGLGVWLPALLPGPSDAVSFAIYLALPLGIVALLLVVTHGLRWRHVPAELGLDRPAASGLCWALLLTLPMLVGFVLLRRNVILEDGAWRVVTERPFAVTRAWAGAGLVEETLFRGYLFRQLVLRARWPESRALLVAGIAFGLAHVPAAWDRGPGGLMGAVAITGAGGAGLCWLLARWDWNLWFVVGWHAFVNLWWMVGRAGDTTGDGAGNALRLGVIALTVLVTLHRHRLPGRAGRAARERSG